MGEIRYGCGIRVGGSAAGADAPTSGGQETPLDRRFPQRDLDPPRTSGHTSARMTTSICYQNKFGTDRLSGFHWHGPGRSQPRSGRHVIAPTLTSQVGDIAEIIKAC
jgi:hypothetical protein